MPRGLTEKTIARWQQRIGATQKWIDDKLRERKEIVRLYRESKGDESYTSSLRSDRQFAANFLWANVQVLIPSIYGGVPKVLVSPRSEFTVPAARSQEKFLNYVLPQIGWWEETKKTILDAFLIGWGVRKIFWKPDSPDVLSPSEEAPPDVEPRDAAEGVPPGSPAMVRWPVQDFLIDPAANWNLSRARWVAFRVWKSLEEWQGDDAYSNTNLLKGGRTLSAFAKVTKEMADSFTGIGEFKDAQMIPGYEIWIRNVDGFDHEMLVIAPGVNRALRYERAWPYPQIETFPCDVLMFHPPVELPDDEPQVPIPEALAWMDLQNAFNVLLSQMVSHVDRWNRQLAVDKTKIDPGSDDLEKIEEGRDGAVISINGDVRQAIAPIEYANLPADYIAVVTLVRQIIDQVSGIGEIERGRAATTVTATAARIQQSNASLRIQSRREVLANSDRRLLRVMKQITQGLVDEPVMLAITGPGGLEWVHLSPSDIRAELDVTIDIDSVNPETIAARQEKLFTALQLVGPILNSPLGVAPGLRELLRQVLRSLGFEEEELYLPPPDTSIPEREHTMWMLGGNPQVLPEQQHQVHIAAHTTFLEEIRGRVEGMIPGLIQTIEDHIRQHEGFLQRARTTGGLSVRGGLRPMAPAQGTPGSFGAVSSESATSSTGLPA